MTGLYVLTEIALGRRARALNSRGAVRRYRPHPLFPRNRVRAQSVYALSCRVRYLGAGSVRV